MLTIVTVRERRPVGLVKRAKRLVTGINENPGLFRVLTEIFAQCSNRLEDIDDILDGFSGIESALLQIFRQQLVDYFECTDSNWDYGNRRGLLLEELIDSLEIGQLNVIHEPVKQKVRSADFCDTQKRRVSELEMNIDFAFKGQTSTTAIECKVTLRNWLLQGGKLRTKSLEKLKYINDIYSYCCGCGYEINVYFCCLDNHPQLAEASEVLSSRSPHVKIIDQARITRALGD